MKVLHLIPDLSGGGAERQLALLAPELCRRGHEVHVALGRSGRNSEANLALLARSPVKLHRIPIRHNNDPAILLHVLRVVRSVMPDLIQTWLLQMDVFGGLAAILARVPFVVSERASALAYPAHWKNWLRLQVAKRAAVVVANSEAGLDYWRTHAPMQHATLIRNGLSLDLLQSAAPADVRGLDLPQDTRIILFAGRLCADKNLATMVDALDEVLSEEKDCVALLFGEGELRSALQVQVAHAASGDRMLMPGFTDELSSWMRRASVYVSISWFEGNPNAILEAMAVGCPVVVSSIPAHREILDDASAMFCDASSAKHVAECIRTILRNPSEAALRAESARLRCASWSVQASASQYHKLYRALVPGKASS